MNSHRSKPSSIRLHAAAWILLAVLAVLMTSCAAGSTPAPTGTATAAANTPTPPATETAVPSPVPSETAEPTAAVEATTSNPVMEVTASPISGLVTPPSPFDGTRAYEDVIYQVELGPRIPGTPEHAQAVDWIAAELESNGWEVEIQETTMLDQPVRNVIAKRGSGQPWSIIGAHFDSRMKADNDPDPANHELPVPGANDGASGVGVLLELARTLPEDTEGEIWLAFFDSEDQGNLPGWDWILGSRAVANALPGQPDSVIIVDMIGDADLNIYQERNSDPGLTSEVWAIAAELGYAQFIHEPKFAMLDDHTPFLEKGIRAIDIIDFDYPYWHTIADTADKVSAESLNAVGDTVLHWLWLHHHP